MLMSKRQQRKLNRLRDRLLAHMTAELVKYKDMYASQLKMTEVWQQNYNRSEKRLMELRHNKQSQTTGIIWVP